MANTWNELSWGLGDWGTQSDTLLIPTGVISSVSVNSLEYTGEPGGWGFLNWGANEWGDLINPNVDVIGLQLNTFAGNEDALANTLVPVSTNLLNCSVESISVVIGQLIVPNSFLLNSTVNSVFAGENIFVEVSTPGTPTTWGQFEWGAYDWNQIAGAAVLQGEELVSISVDANTIGVQLNTTTATAVAGASAEVDPTGVVSNVSVNPVFAGENVIVELTTPGTPTEWGSLAWGQGAWNQISGLQTLQGDESISGTGFLDLTGVQSNTSIGTFTVTGDANLSLNTNLLNITVNSILAVVDVSVEVTSPGQLPWGTISWGYGSWGNIGGMDVEQGGEEVVVPSVEVDVIGNQLNTTIGIYSITGDANLTLNTNLLTVGLGNEDATPNTIVTLSTNLLSASVGIASGETLSLIEVTGVNITASTGRLYVTAWAVVDIGVTNTWSVVDIAA
jgi:hypothetical protein